MSKKKLALIFGGKSAEHTVSLMSARNIEALTKDRYDLSYLVVDINGKIRSVEGIPQEEVVEFVDDEPLLPELELEILNEVDVVFPIIHGSYGEDGRLQGFLEMLGLAYVGENVETSAICMDKDITKRVLEHAGIPVVGWHTLYKGETFDPKGSLYPLFIKPAAQGSSIGISKVKREKQLDLALEEAFNSGDKLLIENFVKARELECSVLCGKVSTVGEITSTHEFYDYESKYFDEGSSQIILPAEIPEAIREEIRDLTGRIAKILGIKYMSRVDFFLDENDQVYLNEINTVPGFTNFSMYTLLWKESGMSGQEIVDTLIEAALEE